MKTYDPLEKEVSTEAAAMTGRRNDDDHGANRVVVDGISKTFATRSGPVEALNGVNFHIRPGEFVSLIGPSGCGKSTVLRILAGLETPSEGEVRIYRENHSRPAVGAVFQNYSIFPWKTVEANVAFGLRMHGASRTEALAEARIWLKKMGLDGFEKKYPGELSGGMKQRVSVARAFALNPELMLMDEPFAALDAQRRDLMQEELLSKWETDGNTSTAMLVTHSLDEAILLGDRVLLMGVKPGRIVNSWDVPFDRPRNPDIRGTAEFAELRDEIWDHLRDQVRETL